MRSIILCLAFALNLGCGGEPDPGTNAQSTDATETPSADAAVSPASTDVTLVADTEEGGAKDDVALPPVPDSSAIEDTADLVDDAGSVPEADIGGLDDDVHAPEGDTEGHDATGAAADAAPHEDVVEPTDTPSQEDVTSTSDVVEDTTSGASDAVGVDSEGTAADAAVEDAEGEEDVVVEPDPCEACLASGGTWQPEANACTEACNIMDISCYTASCPAPCSLESCGTCIGQEECEEIGCQWNAQPPAFWCN
jgi:hypothetical protein